MKPRKVRLTGKMHQIPSEELKQVVGGKGHDTPWTGDLPPGIRNAAGRASDHALANWVNSAWANWNFGNVNPE